MMPVRTFSIHRLHQDNQWTSHEDIVSIEEPLEIRIGERSIAITMRTPGNDRELVTGFLLSEGVIRKRDDILNVTYCLKTSSSESGNIARVELASHVVVNFEKLTRHVFSTSSCGVCGKSTLDSLFQNFSILNPGPIFSSQMIKSLPDRLRQHQPRFSETGGVHASALFDSRGEWSLIREDVGRHNALDKVLGAALNEFDFPLKNFGLLLSGRISFELVQKSLVAGIPLIAGIGAPSSLAIECAIRSKMTLIGFLRSDRMNIYCGKERME